MTEYIEREKVINLLKKYGIKRGNKVYGIADIGDITTFVEDIPAADVAPVRHGRFVHDGPRFAGGVDWWRCSSCGGLVSGAETRFDYCPHCGAKMALEE